MKRYIIDKEIRNEFFFNTVYGLLYPAVLGTALVYIIQDFITGKIFTNGVFSFISLFLLMWYFVLDFSVGSSNFKKNVNMYNIRYLLCDLGVIISFFLAYYGVWLSHFEFLFFLSFAIISSILLMLDYFDASEKQINFCIKNFYDTILSIFLCVSLCMTIISIFFSESLLYQIPKYLFLVFLGAGIFYYTTYILSKESFLE